MQDRSSETDLRWEVEPEKLLYTEGGGGGGDEVVVVAVAAERWKAMKRQN